MQMLSEFERFGDERLGARPRDETAGGKGARPEAAQLRGPAKAAGAGTGPGAALHTISLTTAYGDVVAQEAVDDDGDYGAALHRIYNQAVPRASAVVVLDGVTHTRSSFLEFVRAFDDWAARQRGTPAAA